MTKDTDAAALMMMMASCQAKENVLQFKEGNFYLNSYGKTSEVFLLMKNTNRC